MLDILGFNPYDPTRVRAEHKADFKGAKNGEKVDYALFCQNRLVMLVEAKNYAQTLPNHDAQLARYFNSSVGVTIAVITNGREWRFFTDLNNKNVMDDEPFLVLDFSLGNNVHYEQLFYFQYDEFQPEKLRAVAEENRYLATFQDYIGHKKAPIPRELRLSGHLRMSSDIYLVRQEGLEPAPFRTGT
jgi:hypothetical protein